MVHLNRPSFRERTCSVCDQSKIWIRKGKMYTDEKGFQWRGTKCPLCYRLYVRQQKAKDRARERAKEAKDNETIAGPTYTLRYCRKCATELPPTRYFTHETCGRIASYYDIFADYQEHARG